MTDSTTIEALAEAWASIDRKLDEFRGGKGGHYSGYMADAGELAKRLMQRGFSIAPAAEISRLQTLVLEQGQEVAITRERDESLDAEVARLRWRLLQSGNVTPEEAAAWNCGDGQSTNKEG